MKPGRDRDELCYPFIYEHSSLCDFEVITDELCAHVGMAYSRTPAEMADVREDLDRVQPLVFHANGSLRGRLALEEADLAWLKARLDHYGAEVRDRLKTFVLPRGEPPVEQLHLARSAAKKAVRCLVRVEEEGREIPLIVPRLCNLLSNFFFTLTLVVNARRGLEEKPFFSKSYGPSPG